MSENIWMPPGIWLKVLIQFPPLEEGRRESGWMGREGDRESESEPYNPSRDGIKPFVGSEPSGLNSPRQASPPSTVVVGSKSATYAFQGT